ncbi:MAG: hypothetical protein A2751_05815 [Candidatus Doudnabacteria bacterium RIFCSPHIGHO2_01_FULL_46_14]|uniref:DUF5673 domain-containing protein n=1 Tax=Candidatus Doudnabacteria bacterium RIFCSPHIGHO2_01_FULL_46_14 TaxID=1817824 RepID=A0A1F5NN63_9BACT|nr:MAG: hypothetical protein A2751_05815 [Candidatus Doudnabacteria bacterium RIFCSPHIGHO2_01_FULL_46_14]
MEKKEIIWSAPEFIHYPKGPKWYLVLGIFGALLVGYFFFKKDFLTAMMFILLFLMAFFFSRAKPRQMRIILGPRGVTMNDSHIPYQQVKTFWLVYEPPDIKTVNFETSAYLNRFLTLQLEDQNPSEVRDFLLDYLPEDLDREERISDKISRTLKF